MKTAFLIAAALFSTQVLAEDARQLAPLPPAAQEALREEMRGNLLALNEILTLMADGKVKEAGEVAEKSLGRGAMGKHMDKPFDARPGPNMPREMHRIGMDGHGDASEFAKAAASGDRDKALALLPKLTSSCIACHFSYRIR
ncbi:MAG: cytochrome c [Sulfuritalea sp.]|nr:cytochrome c [Sulfuritalea sp.]